MLINTNYFGDLNYETKDILYLDNGLFGFEDKTEYILIHVIPDDSTLLCLQSIQDESLAFILINPFSLDPSYDPLLAPEDMTALGLKEDSSVTYYSICSIHDNAGDSTVNLRCPLVINPDTRRGRQAMLENQEYSLRHTLLELSGTGKEEPPC